MPTETLRAEPDSSTHASTAKKGRRKRKRRERKHSSKKKRHRQESPSSSDSKDASETSDTVLSDPANDSEEERNIEKEGTKFEFDIKPLEQYLPDIKSLYKEIFALVNKKEFKRMLPENLKKYEPKEVRTWCLEEMEGISIKRLKAVLNGKAMTSSSSESELANSDTESSTQKQVEEAAADKEVNPEKKKVSRVNEVSDQVAQDFSILAELSQSPNETEIHELLEGDLLAAKESDKKAGGESADQINSGEVKPESKSEIRELELRARALQSFLKFQEKRQIEKQRRQSETSPSDGYLLS